MMTSTIYFGKPSNSIKDKPYMTWRHPLNFHIIYSFISVSDSHVYLVLLEISPMDPL